MPGWAGQTWLNLVQEGTAGANYGVFNSTPAAGQSIFPSLYGPNSFTVRDVPQRQIIRTADAGNRRRDVVAARHVFQGTLNTVLRPDEAAFWITAATTLTNDAGAHPWLPSYSALFWDSTQAWKLLGGMIQSMTLTSSATQDYISMTMNWVFQKRDATFTTYPQPAESNYSILVPYEHVETAGHITLAASAVTKYRSVTLNFNNTLQPTWDENPYISACYYCGRDFDFTFGPQYVSNILRGDFEQQTPLTFVLGIIRASPAHSLTITANAKSYIANIDDDLPLDGPAYQTVNVQVFFDPAVGNDFTTAVS